MERTVASVPPDAALEKVMPVKLGPSSIFGPSFLFAVRAER